MSQAYLARGPEGFGAYRVAWHDGRPEFVGLADGAETVLVPGLVDLHSHGAFGVDFMTATDAELGQLADSLGDLGYEAFLPTTVTAPREAVERAVARPWQDARTPGFHLEGPFISPVFPGAQPPEWIVDPPSPGSAWDAVLDHPALRLVTLAPERPGGRELATRLSARGVVVSMGHTDATYDEAAAAHAAGVTHATHTYNAMRGLHHREAGALGAVFLTPGITAELIYDRHHVSRPAAELLLRTKGAAGVVAVSDSTRATGLPPGTELDMWGHRSRTSDGTVRLTANGALAGSAVTLLDCFRNLAADFDLETAIILTGETPRRVLGMGPPKVWVELSPELDVLKVRDQRPV